MGIFDNRIIVGGNLYYHPILLAAAVAHLGHAATDHFHNGISPWGYSITYRAFVRFETARDAPSLNVLDAYKSWVGFLPFGNRLRPCYTRKIEPWFQSRIGD